MTGSDWFPDWAGQTCIIVASGPSAKQTPIAEAKGLARFIAVNNSWELAPWADALYACDYRWWDQNKSATKFGGLKISQDVKCNRFPDIQIIRTIRGRNELVLEPKGSVGWGGNGGFHSLNLAVQFGAKRIILVGFDMHQRAGIHWHGKHRGNLTNPNERALENWRLVLDKCAPRLKALGIEVFNASETSALKAYPKVKFSDLFARPLSVSLSSSLAA